MPGSSFLTEIEKIARTRRAFLRFALAENNPNRPWAGPIDRQYGKVDDAQREVPVAGTVSRFGTIQRSLATFLTSLEVPNVSIELFDPYREWRALGGGLNDQLTYRAVSLWLRVLDDVFAPYDERIAVAHIRKPSFPAGGKVQLDCQVASGSFLGAKVPRRFITTEDFPNAPPETQGLPVPIIYGRRSNVVSPFEIPPAEPPPDSTPPGLPGGNPDSDIPATLPTSGTFTVNCSDLWVDTFEDALDGYSAGTANFTLVPGAGADGSQAVRPVVDGAELVKTLSPPRRAFCVEWSSDHDYLASVEEVTLVDGVNVYRVSERDVVIQVPWAGQLTRLVALITPGTRQSFRLEGAFATKNFDVTLTAPLTPSQTVLQLSPADAARLSAGMHLQVNGEIVRVLSVGSGGSVNIIRAQFGTFAGGGAHLVGGTWVYYPAIVDAGTVSTTYDLNGYLKFLVNGTSRYSVSNTDVIRCVSATGIWSKVAFAPGGDGDNLKIGSGLLSTPGTDYIPGTQWTAPNAGDPNNPSPTPECQPGHEGGSPSGAAVRALLVGTYAMGNTGSGQPGETVTHPCGDRTPYGSVEALAEALQVSKDAGTLMDDWPRCIGYRDTQTLIDLDGPIPTTDAELAALIGWNDMNCLAYGDCTYSSGGTASAGAGDNLYVLAGHALKALTGVFVLKPVVIQNFTDDGDESPTRSEPVQVQMVEGVDYRQGWLDINGHRYHMIAFNAAQISETCEYYEVTVNVEGIETNADSTGTLIENADEIVEHIMLNWILNSYESGPWFTDVAYAPGVWDHASVERVKAIAAARIPGGYKGMGTLDTVIEAREWLRELLISYDLELFFNNNIGSTGAWSLSRFDPYQILSTIPRWDAGQDPIFRDSFSSEIAVDQLINTFPFFAGPTTQKLDTKGTSAPRVSGGGWLLSGTFDSPSSIERYGVAKSDPIYLKWTDDAPTVGDVMSHYLRYLELPPVPANFRMGLKALGSPLGSLVRVTHPDGPGSTGLWPAGIAEGWVDHVCKVTRSDIDMDRLVANVKVESVDRLMRTPPPPAEDEVLVFSFNGQAPLGFVNTSGQLLEGPACDPAASMGALWGGFFQADNGLIACAGMNLLGSSDCFALYNASFVRIFGAPGPQTHGLGWLYNGSMFWVHQTNGGVQQIQQVNSSGTLVATKGPLPTPPDDNFWRTLTVSPDGSVAYYASTNTIKRWNLTANSAMADLVTLPNHSIRNMFCLRDGTLIVAWNEPAHADKIIRYSTAGAVLGTRPAPGGLAYIAPGPTDATIWGLGYQTGFTLIVAELQVSTGTILRQFPLQLTAASWDGPFLVLKTALP
jgi:hypothetical protein